MLSGIVDIYRKVKAKALMIDQQIWPLLFFLLLIQMEILMKICVE
jgi:hypothetical protein